MLVGASLDMSRRLFCLVAAVDSADLVVYSSPAMVDSSFVRSFLACFMRVLMVLEEARAPPYIFAKIIY